MTKKNPFLTAALDYATKRGWRVFPLQPGEKEPFGGTHGHLDGTDDPEQIKAWWRENPDANVGLRCDPVRGPFVVDVDGPEARRSVRELRLPATLEASSGRAGRRHLYFAIPDGVPSELARRYIKIRPSLDLLGDGYVVAPPSFRRDTGKPYEWLNDRDVATLPPSVEKLVAKHNAGKASKDEPTNKKGVSPLTLLPASLPVRNAHLTDEEVCELIAAANASEFHRLFEAGETRAGKSASESDLALACMFVRHVGGDAERIDQLMRQSALADEAGRDAPKWDTRRGDMTWLARTIQRAISTVARERPPEQTTERRLYSLADILLDDELLVKPDPLLPHVAWPGRLSLLAGREKYAGKSTFLASAAACVSRGRAFLGQPCAPSDVLWVSADLEHTYDLAERFIRYDAEPARVHVLYPAFGALEERLAEIEALVAQVQPKLVVLDTLSNLVRVKDPFSSNEWPEALLRLKELARVHDAAIIVVHHTTKADEEEYRDSTAIGATVDQIVLLVNRRKRKNAGPANRRALISRGRLGVSEISVDLGRDGYRVAESVTHALERRVREVVAEEPGVSRRRIIELIGGKQEHVVSAIDALVRRGTLANTGTEQKHAYVVREQAVASDAITLTIEQFERGRTTSKIAAWRADRAATVQPERP
ncbi:MAG: bifunctional DNA primase/polymerase [Gemmatimonadaceae bacterium]